MSKPYDATLKAMLEASPSDWPRLAGFEPGRVDVIDADVSTITAATDKVLRLTGAQRTLMHFDFQAGPDADLPRRVLGYNTLLGHKHGLPVHTVVVLLRPQANLRTIDGLYKQHYPGVAAPYLTFRYQVLRVWEIPAADLLQGGIGTLALAPIGALERKELRGVIRVMKQRLERPQYDRSAGETWTAVKVLMGLRYEDALIEELLRGIHQMKESVTYQAIVEEGRAEGLEMGRAEGARNFLLHMAERKFKEPANAATRAALEAITSVEALEQLGFALQDAHSWEELVPVTRPRKKKS